MIFKKKTEQEKQEDKSNQMQNLMNKFGITAKKIDAQQVQIITSEKDIVISRPEVVLTNVMGREVYQITGDILEVPKDLPASNKYSEMKEQPKESVEQELQELDYDLAKAKSELKSVKKK